MDALTEEGNTRRAVEDAVKVVVEKMHAYKRAKQIASRKCQLSEIAKACGEKMAEHHVNMQKDVNSAKDTILTIRTNLVQTHQENLEKCQDLQEVVRLQIAETSSIMYGNEDKIMQVAEATGWSISASTKALEKEISQLDQELLRVRNARGKEGFAENMERIQEIKNKKNECDQEKRVLEELQDEWESRGFKACKRKEIIGKKGMVNCQAEEEAARIWVAQHVPPEAESVTDLAPAVSNENDPAVAMTKMMQMIQELQAQVQFLQHSPSDAEVKLPVPEDLAK
eukprot:GEMP01020544.1.p1 GENE.GEMP01020544.1~~GEMP01020544.1.p1  ORF type:complete len:283 (+),score=75.15 GEMP01020544.1:728-1576(+)